MIDETRYSPRNPNQSLLLATKTSFLLLSHLLLSQNLPQSPSRSYVRCPPPLIYPPLLAHMNPAFYAIPIFPQSPFRFTYPSPSAVSHSHSLPAEIHGADLTSNRLFVILLIGCKIDLNRDPWKAGRARLIAPLLKSGNPQGFGGSNPSPSAITFQIRPLLMMSFRTDERGFLLKDNEKRLPLLQVAFLFAPHRYRKIIRIDKQVP